MKSDYLIRAGHAAPSADNSQPWHFHLYGENLFINYDAPRVQGLTFPAWAPATLLSIGGVIENISQAASGPGLALRINPLPNECPLPDCYAQIEVPNYPPPDRNQEQHRLFQRHTNRFRFKNTPVPIDVLNSLESMAEGDAKVIPFTTRPDIRTLAQLAQSASEVRFQTKEIHEWLGKSLRFSTADVEKADGLDVRTLDLPPGGRHFLEFISDWKRIRILNKVGIYKMLAKIDSTPLKKAPGILAIVGRQGELGALEAGRLLTRAWIHLNSEGIAVHPYYVVPDQIFRLKEGGVPEHLVAQIQEVASRAEQVFDLDHDRVIYMMLRIGYPTREPLRSRRLPLSVVYTNSSPPDE